MNNSIRKSLKILVYNTAASTSGALSILTDFASYVRNNPGDAEWLFVVSQDGIIDKADRVSVMVRKEPKQGFIKRLIFELFALKKIIKNFSPDILFSLQNLTVPFAGVPQMVYIHQSIPFSDFHKWSYWKRNERAFAFYRDVYKWFIRFSVHKAKKVIVQTNWMRDAMVNAFRIKDASKVVVIPPHVHLLNVLNDDKTIHYNKQAFFYPATPFEYKNILRLLMATEKILQEGHRITLHLTIRGDENEYACIIKEYSKRIPQAVILHGQIDRADVFSMYKKCNLVFPSYIESFGIPLLEACMNEAFVVASDLAFSREILYGYPNAVFFDPFSVDSIANAMLVAMERKESHQVNDTDFLDYFSAENTWGKIVNQIHNWYIIKENHVQK